MFRTKVIPKKSPFKIGHEDSILAMGSCFVESIGQKLRDAKFNISINPFGTLFNPLSIFKLVNLAGQGKNIDQERIVNEQEVFHHYDLHSYFSSVDQADLSGNANMKLRQLESQLAETSVIIYTFGSSIVYKLKETG